MTAPTRPQSPGWLLALAATLAALAALLFLAWWMSGQFVDFVARMP